MEAIKVLLEMMEPLPGKISELLQQRRGRRLTANGDLVLWCWGYIRAELTGLVASLRQIYSTSELGPDYVGDDFWKWWKLSAFLTHEVRGSLDRSEQASLCGCHTHCFSHDAGFPLSYVFQRPSNFITESPWRYMHLLQDGDGHRTSRTSSSYMIDDVGGNTFLVGIEGALSNKKLRWFMANREADDSLKIIFMVGPAGVGKTTLAMKVYGQLQQTGGGHYFECCATVKVSQRPDIKEVLKHILSQINKPAGLSLDVPIGASAPITTLDGQELLVRNINECLREKRYLILIDDIGKDSDWHIIKKAFPQNNLGSRIMITTQLTSVVPLSRFVNMHVHEVKPLSELDSKRLLSQKAFGSESCYPQENLKQVCDEILRRCGGIPLFISCMADWLREQQKEVQHIPTSYSMEIFHKLRSEFEQPLSIIYADLPNRLKLLLMYMSMFPEGYIFDKDSFIERSVAEGLFNRYKFDDSPYEVEETKVAFSELWKRNVITRVAASYENTSKDEENCHWQVNYFMLQSLASKSADKGFLCTGDTLASVVAGGSKTLRRLSLHQPDPELPKLLGEMDLSHTHSLAISGKVDRFSLDKFIYLVVLDLEGWRCYKDEDMLSICKMFVLQYLSLRNTGVSTLPPKIKELRKLRTLDISYTMINGLPLQVFELWLWRLDLRSTQVRQLPVEIWKLKWLRSLLVGGDGANRYEKPTAIPEGVGRPDFLHTLETVDLSQCSPSLVEALGGIRKLKMLAITWSFHQCTDRRFQEALCSSIKSWEWLESLTIHCGLGCCMDFLDSPLNERDQFKKFKMTGGRFARLPQWFHQLRTLTSIEITVCSLEPGDVDILCNLPSLVCLVLGLHFIPEAAIVIDGVGFRMLERLSVSCRVPWLTFSEEAMPQLTHLELKIAGGLTSQERVPSGIGNLWSLSEVAVRYHANYVNSLSVKMTVDAVRKEVADHCKLFINGIQDHEEDSSVS